MSSNDLSNGQQVFASFAATASGGANDIAALGATITITRAKGTMRRIRIEGTAAGVVANQKSTLTYVIPATVPAEAWPLPLRNVRHVATILIGGVEHLCLVSLVPPGNLYIQVMGAPAGAGSVVVQDLVAGDVGAALVITPIIFEYDAAL